MTLQQMRYICEIDRCGSMNKAAKSLFVSQSTLSSAIAEAEKELGITIFRRSNRGIVLTEDGRDLLSQITPILEQSRRLSRFYARRKAGDRLHLSVSAQHYPFCAKAFVELFNSLDKLPMQLSLIETDMASVIAEVAAGQSDLGVLFVSDLTEPHIKRTLEEKGLVFHPLVTLQPHVFMRNCHPLSARASLRLDDLRPYPHVVFTQPDSNLNYAEEAVFGSGIDFEQMVYVNDRASIYNIMAHTDCVSTGSGILPEGYADAGLISLPLEEFSQLRLGYVLKSAHRLSDVEESFVGILRRITAESAG